MLANDRTYLEALTIERVMKLAGEKLPKPVAEAYADYVQKFELFEKAQANLAAARVAQTELIAAQRVAKTEAAKQAQPDPTNKADLEAMSEKVDYETMSVRETGNVARLAGKQLAAKFAENYDDIMPKLVAAYESKLAQAAEAQTQALEILEPAFTELNEALTGIKTVAAMNSRTSILNAAKYEKEKTRLPKFDPLPTPSDSQTLAAINRPTQTIARDSQNSPRLLSW